MADNAMCVIQFSVKYESQLSKVEGGKQSERKINFQFYITENFEQINAFNFQYKFDLEWKNENYSSKYFLKSYLAYKQLK